MKTIRVKNFVLGLFLLGVALILCLTYIAVCTFPEAKSINKKSKKDSQKIHYEHGPVIAALKVPGPAPEFRKGRRGNYETPTHAQRGPGEGGAAVVLPAKLKAAADKSVREFGFNMVASDRVAWNRSLPDVRDPECKHWFYPEDLPTASVILVFFNEGWSTLLRTVYSVINTSPKRLLKEVILVDDASEYDFLGEKLAKYIKRWGGLVKLTRHKTRKGLIIARTNGARVATGDVIVYLDAHCECNKNWLPPLLAEIRRDRTTLAVPIIDGIKWEDMSYYHMYGSSGTFHGIFEWGFLYKEAAVPQSVLAKRKHKSEPYMAPTHAGGLLAIDRKFFFTLGAYDPGLQIWGGENYELAFKVWQCGGRSVWVPCSRVGHIYRGPRRGGGPKHPPRPPKIPYSYTNYQRVVHVWMERPYRDWFYTREPWLRGAPFGDVTKQRELKAKLKCKDFHWFMTHVAGHVLHDFPAPPPNFAWGEFRLRSTTSGGTSRDSCWFAYQNIGFQVRLEHCFRSYGMNLFRLNIAGQLAIGERCLVPSRDGGVGVIVCPREPKGEWSFDRYAGRLSHGSGGSKRCVTAVGRAVRMMPCAQSLLNQRWAINEFFPWKDN